MRKLVVLLAFALICPFVAAQQAALNNDGVIKLVKAGLSDDLVVSTINASPGAYDISVNALVALKGAGVSDKVIAAMVAKAGAAAPSPVSSGASELASPSASGPVKPGARVVIAPMGGFETYFAAAVREKGVPITLTLDKASAQYFVVSTNTEWQGFVYGAAGAASGRTAAFGSSASTTRGLEASIMLIDARTKDVVWAYEVHKNSHGALIFGTFGARGQQSIAEACAKHLKEYIEKGK